MEFKWGPARRIWLSQGRDARRAHHTVANIVQISRYRRLQGHGTARYLKCRVAIDERSADAGGFKNARFVTTRLISCGGQMEQLGNKRFERELLATTDQFNDLVSASGRH